MEEKLALHDAAVYEICFQGALDHAWVNYLYPHMSVHVNEDNPRSVTSTITGEVCDQAALLGLLNSLYNLGLPLLSVHRIAQ